MHRTVIIEIDARKSPGSPGSHKIVAGITPILQLDLTSSIRDGPGAHARLGNVEGYGSLSPDDKILFFVDVMDHSKCARSFVLGML